MGNAMQSSVFFPTHTQKAGRGLGMRLHTATCPNMNALTSLGIRICCVVVAGPAAV